MQVGNFRNNRLMLGEMLTVGAGHILGSQGVQRNCESQTPGVLQDQKVEPFLLFLFLSMFPSNIEILNKNGSGSKRKKYNLPKMSLKDSNVPWVGLKKKKSDRFWKQNHQNSINIQGCLPGHSFLQTGHRWDSQCFLCVSALCGML